MDIYQKNMKTSDYLNEQNLKVIGGFIFDHLNQSKQHERIKQNNFNLRSFK